MTKCIMCGSEVESDSPVVICTGCGEAKSEPVATNRIYEDAVFPSGKYEGELITDVSIEDEDYYVWAVEQSMLGHDTKEACKYHLRWL